MVRNENGFLAGYVYVDIEGRDVGGYVEEARARVNQNLTLPLGTVLSWSGQYENMQRVRERLKLVVPVTIGLIFLLLYANTRSYFKTFLVLLAVPFPRSEPSGCFTGWITTSPSPPQLESSPCWVLMRKREFHAAVSRSGFRRGPAKGKLRTLADLDEALVHGAVKRVRPKLMAASLAGLLPILLSTATGSDVMKRIAAPMIGGLVTSFLLELLVYPPVYKLWLKRMARKKGGLDWPPPWSNPHSL